MPHRAAHQHSGRLISHLLLAGVLGLTSLPAALAQSTAQSAAQVSTTNPTALDKAQSDKPLWPPMIPGANKLGYATYTSQTLLEIPPEVAQAAKALDYKFEVAKTPPRVDLYFHRDLPDQGVGPDNGTGWTSWGDICVASDGSVYSAIGDHGRDGTRLKEGQKSDAHVFVYRWSPENKALRQVVAPNVVTKAGPDDPNWSKIHAGIFEDHDGNIVFIPTFNAGQRAPDAKWTPNVPTGQIYSYNPETNQTRIIGLLPENSATATTEYDPKRNILYVNLEGQFENALFAFDLNDNKPVFQGEPNMIGQNRNMAIGRDGSVYFNAKDATIGKYDPQTKTISSTGLKLPNDAAMRASTAQASDGWIYAVTYGGTAGRAGHLVRFNPEKNTLEDLGYEFLNIDRKGKPSLGNYTTVCVLSPDEKFVYFLPGAHGGAVHIGTPVVQYNIATGKTKVLAFLKPIMETQADYVPGGTYGIAISKDGSTLYANLNGHAVEKNRLERMRPNGFGLTSFVAIHIPESER